MAKEFLIPAKMIRNMQINQLNQNKIERVDYEVTKFVKRGAEDNDGKIYFFETVDKEKYEANKTIEQKDPYSHSEDITNVKINKIGDYTYDKEMEVKTSVSFEIKLEARVKFLLEDLEITYDETLYKQTFNKNSYGGWYSGKSKSTSKNIKLSQVGNVDSVGNKFKNCYQLVRKTPQEIIIKFNLLVFEYFYDGFAIGNTQTGSYKMFKQKNNNYELKIKAPYYDEENESRFVGNENSEYSFTLDTNNFMNISTKINEIQISEYIAKNIVDNYQYGKERVSLECIIGNYYDRNNNLIYSKNSIIPIMDVGDTFELYNPLNRQWENGYYHKKFIITDREFSYNGVPTIKIEGKEI